MNEEITLKVNAIAECIYSKYSETLSIPRNLGVYNGNSGVILFLFYYAKYTRNEKYNQLAESLVSKLLDRFSYDITLSSFSGGLSGILYLFEFLREHDFIDIDVDDFNEDIERCLFEQMQKDIRNRQYDFMHGALGLGLYFLKKKSFRTSILTLIDFLYDTAEKDLDLNIFKWKSIIDHEKNIEGYNISLSHGVSSIVIFLSKVIQSGVSSEKVLLMQKGAVNYLLSQRLDDERGLSLFPSQSKENDGIDSIKYSRLAWCYGDLGIGLALLRAGQSVRNEDWITMGVYVLERSTHRRDLYQNFVIDGGICHGSAGISMIYNRIYLETNKDCFLFASQYWLDETLKIAHFEDGLAGYKTFFQNEYLLDYSLLTGVSGVGITFLSGLYKDRQEWDEILLLT